MRELLISAVRITIGERMGHPSAADKHGRSLGGLDRMA
jgi:hypothetical protein